MLVSGSVFYETEKVIKVLPVQCIIYPDRVDVCTPSAREPTLLISRIEDVRMYVYRVLDFKKDSFLAYFYSTCGFLGIIGPKYLLSSTNHGIINPKFPRDI